jgi:hypothetical protein
LRSRRRGAPAVAGRGWTRRQGTGWRK